jgi:hypothetical protein
MKHPGKEFYEMWAKREAANPDRKTTLKWKAVNMANLVLRTLKGESIRSICEIGGAEGIVLNAIGRLIDASELVNYDLSSVFCEAGKLEFPEIEFVNEEFRQRGASYDLIVLSDIIEHVEDESEFLKIVSARCRFAVFKIPIEKCITNADLVYKLRGRPKPENLRYGSTHINGHLRGYTLGQAQASVARYFNILDMQEADVLNFYGTPRQFRIKRWLGVKSTVWLFGGALFVLGQSKKFKEE